MVRRSLSILTSLLVLLLTATSLSAQDYVFGTMSTSDGFPSKVTSIYAHNRSFAWAGSDEGLVRMDNSSFKIYRHSQKSGSLPGDYIYKVFADGNGRIWALTDKGMARYDGDSDTFTVPLVNTDGKDVPVIAYSVLKTDDGFIAGGDNVLYKYVSRTDRAEVIRQTISGHEFQVNSIFRRTDGRILLHSRKGGLLIYDEVTSELSPAPFETEGQISALLVDSDGDVWMSPYNKGLDWITADGSAKESYNTDNGRLGSNIVLCLAETEGHIWAGTDGGGIVIIDKKSGEVQRTLRHERDDPSYIPSDTILSLYCESDGMVWAGRNKGGLIWVKESLIHTYLSGDFQYRSKSEGVTSLYQAADNAGTIWVGSEGSGILRFTPSDGKFQYYPYTEGLKVFDLASYPGGRIFVSTIAKGFFLFDPATEKLEPIRLPSDDLEEYARYSGFGVCVHNDEEGRMILLADNIYRYTPSLDKIEVFRLPPKTEPGEFHAVFGKGSEQYFHNRTSLYVWDKHSDIPEFVINLGEDTSINSAALGREGEIWVATEDGIGCYLKADGSFTPVESFFLKGSKSIIYDSKGRIWVGTRQGMYIYYPADGSVVAMGWADGVSQNDYAPHARLRSNSGDIYFGGVKGMLRADQSINFNLSDVPEVILTDLYLDSERISDKSKLSLKQNYKSLGIEIFAKEDNILREKEYRFMFKGPGIDDVFTSEVPTATISYHNPGKYRVYASCTCANGKWTEWAEMISFKVNTKWYFSWWAILILLGLIALITGLYVSHILNQRAEHQVRETEEERIKFLVNVSHELRTPLTLILGPLGRILREMPQTDPHYSPLSNVNRQALRMKSLLNTVLTAHKIEEGASNLNLASRDLGEWIDHVVNGFRDEAKGRSINLVTKFDKNARTLTFDDDKCQIVLSNILMNAIKHSPSDSTITVATESRPIDKMVRVTVSDQGSGFTIKDTSKLFERFYQESGNSRNGFGIGLSYCKTIIEQHKGTIGAYNNADGGATFYYDLPADMAEEIFKNTGIQEKSRISAHKTAIGIKDAVILLVDDNVDFRDFLREEISHKARNVIVAGNGKEALDLLQAEHVDIILSDIMMPVMDGFELCRRVKAGEAGFAIPVILLTARSDENSRILGLQNGADGYLVKPFDTEEMTSLVRALLNKN